MFFLCHKAKCARPKNRAGLRHFAYPARPIGMGAQFLQLCIKEYLRTAMKSNICLLNWMKLGYNYVLYIYSFHLLYLYSIQKQSTEVFFRKVYLKISQSLQESTCTGVSFLSAGSNFVNKEAPEQCFPKSLTLFGKKLNRRFSTGF